MKRSRKDHKEVKKMDNYEIMFIVKNTIEDEAVNKEAEALKAIITTGKGKII